MVSKFFDKKSESSCIKSMSDQQLADELYQANIRRYKIPKVYSSFNDNIWGADLPDMQLISKSNREIKFLLCVIDIISKYAWVFPLKDKKIITIVNAFQSILNNSEK